MDRAIIEQELVANVASQKRTREQLLDADSRVDEAMALLEDQRLRSLASETPVSGKQLIEAQYNADKFITDRERLLGVLSEVDQTQSRLVDLLPSPDSSRSGA